MALRNSPSLNWLIWLETAGPAFAWRAIVTVRRACQRATTTAVAAASAVIMAMTLCSCPLIRKASVRNASRRHNGRDSGNARQNGGMSAAEITLLSGDGAAEAEALGRLLAQVSSHPVPLTADRVREVLRTPSTSVLVARLGGEIVGMALLLTLTTLSGDTGYVEEVVVDQTARGQHISTALMRALLDLAARKGLRFVDLTSRPSRVVANRLYQSLGFRLRETNCYRHDLATR
jgi:GNAT superfamily N-acetyltransferase